MFSEMTLHLRMQHHHQKGQAWVPTQACKPALLDPLLNISSFSYQPHHNLFWQRTGAESGTVLRAPWLWKHLESGSRPSNCLYEWGFLDYLVWDHRPPYLSHFFALVILCFCSIGSVRMCVLKNKGGQRFCGYFAKFFIGIFSWKWRYILLAYWELTYLSKLMSLGNHDANLHLQPKMTLKYYCS